MLTPTGFVIFHMEGGEPVPYYSVDLDILYQASIATNQRVVAAKQSGNSEGWLLLLLEALVCSIHLQYEGLISILPTDFRYLYGVD